MNTLCKNHVHAKQNHSWRQSRCVATSDWHCHIHFLSLFVTCFKSLIAGKVCLVTTGKVIIYTNTSCFEIMHICDILIECLHNKICIFPHCDFQCLILPTIKKIFIYWYGLRKTVSTNTVIKKPIRELSQVKNRAHFLLYDISKTIPYKCKHHTFVCL